MNFNQTVTKEEKDAIAKRFKGTFGLYYLLHIIFLMVAFGCVLYMAYIAVISFIAQNYFYIFVSAVLIFLMHYPIRQSFYNCRIKKTFTYMHKLDRLMSGRGYCSVCSDGEKITVNEKAAIRWKDVISVFMYNEYIILGSQKKLAVIVKASDEQKDEICRFMTDNKKAILILEGNREYVKYIQQAIQRTKKKRFSLFLLSVAVLIAMLVKMFMPGGSNKASAQKPAFDPDKSFSSQMSNALEVNEYTGFGFDTEYMFDIYREYVKYYFNTASKVYGDTPRDKELCFFDKEETLLGLKLIRSDGADKGQLYYSNGNKILTIKETPGGKSDAKVKKNKLKNWDKQFYELIEYDYTVKNYPIMKTFGGSIKDFSGSDSVNASQLGFYVEFTNENEDVISYGFGWNFISVEERVDGKIQKSFIIAVSNKSTDNITYIAETFDKAINEGEKSADEQDIDFDKLAETVEEYSYFEVKKE